MGSRAGGERFLHPHLPFWGVNTQHLQREKPRPSSANILLEVKANTTNSSESEHGSSWGAGLGEGVLPTALILAEALGILNSVMVVSVTRRTQKVDLEM